MLGTSENRKTVLLVGESNSAMADPAQMMALSLTTTTVALISSYPTIDRIAAAQMLQNLCNEIATIFMRLGPETLKEHRKQNAALRKREAKPFTS
jgi:hypothetical protein